MKYETGFRVRNSLISRETKKKKKEKKKKMWDTRRNLHKIKSNSDYDGEHAARVNQ